MRISVPHEDMNNLLQHQSVNKALRGNLSQGQPTTYDVNNIPTAYDQDNMSGNLFRYQFTTINLDETIIHNLGRIPIGYYITRKDQPVDVYDGTTTSWTNEIIILKATAAADITIYIF